MLKQAAYNIVADGSFSTGLSDVGGHIQISLDGIIQDTIGWGTATQPEGSPATVATKGKSISRVVSGDGAYQDTDNNAVDFIETSPNPQGGGVQETAVDICPNIADIQEDIPVGYEMDGSGNCILPQRCIIEISEVSSQPNFLGQEQLEYIELVNNSTETVNTSLCHLSINGGALKAITPVDLMPGARYVVSYPSGTIRNSAGSIILTESSGEIVSYTYPETFSGQVINFESGTTIGAVSDVPTPGEVNQTVLLNEESATESGSEIVAACPAGKYRNPATNRCKSYETAVATLASCDEDQERNPATNRCRKVATVSASLASCAADQERNPATNRCRKIASTASSTLKPCEAGQERNPATNRCRKASSSTINTSTATIPQPLGSTKKGLLQFDARIIALIVVSLLAYAIYEYRIDIKNLYNKIREEHTRGRPPD